MKRIAAVLAIAVLASLGIYSFKGGGGSAPSTGEPPTPAAVLPEEPSMVPPVSDSVDSSVQRLPAAHRDRTPQAIALDEHSKPQPAIINGRITRTDGKSMEGARVGVWQEVKLPPGIVDEEGTFRIETLATVATSFYVDMDGQRFGVDRKVRPEAGQESFIELRVEVGHQLEGRVVERRTGQSVPDTRITLIRTGAGRQADITHVRTDDHGEFIVSFLPENTYLLRVSDDRYQSYQEQIEIPARELVTVELADPKELRITLNGHEHYEPQEKIMVWLIRHTESGVTNDSSMKSGKPDEYGLLTITAPPPGTWWAQLSGSGKFPNTSQKVVIGDGVEPAVMSVDLPKPGDVIVTGRVLDSTGTPVGRGSIGLGSSKSAVAEDGTYQLDELKVGRGYVSWSNEAGTLQVGLGTFEVPDRDQVRQDFVVPGTAEVAVRIDGLPDDLAVNRLTVTLQPAGAKTRAANIQGSGKADGEVFLEFVPVGRYLLIPTLWSNSVVRLAEFEIEVDSDRDVHECVIEYKPKATIVVTFEFPEGDAPPDQIKATVQRSSANTMPVVLELQDSMATLDFYGEGDYEVVFESLGRALQPATRTINAVPGEETRVAVEFSEKSP